MFPPPPGRVLVGGAGGGREAFALAGQGYEVVAFEPSATLARSMADRAAKTGAAVHSLVGRYTDLPILETMTGEALDLRTSPRFSAALLGWSSFSHLRHPHQRTETLSAFAGLTDGPVLASFYLRQHAARSRSRLARASVARGLRAEGDRFSPYVGFFHQSTPGELQAEVDAAGLAIVAESYDESDGYWPWIAVARPGLAAGFPAARLILRPVLRREQPGEHPVASGKGRPCPRLCQLSGLEHVDDVGVANRRQAVRDHDCREASLERANGGENLPLVRRVERAGSLVEQQQVRLHEERAGQGEALPLAAREARSTVADNGVEPRGRARTNAAAAACSSASQSSASVASGLAHRRFARMVSCRRKVSWPTYPTRRRHDRPTGPTSGVPSTETMPSRASNSPSIRLASVDFPLPEAPTTAVVSPARQEREMPCSTGGPCA